MDFLGGSTSEATKSVRVIFFCVDLTWNANYDCKFFLEYLFVIGKSLSSQRFPARQWLAEYYHENITSQNFQAATYLIPLSMDTVTNLYARVEPSISTAEFTPTTMQAPVD